MDCTEAEHLTQWGSYWHSVLWNGTGDTSTGKGSLDTGEHPAITRHSVISQRYLKKALQRVVAQVALFWRDHVGLSC